MGKWVIFSSRILLHVKNLNPLSKTKIYIYIYIYIYVYFKLTMTLRNIKIILYNYTNIIVGSRANINKLVYIYGRRESREKMFIKSVLKFSVS